MPYMLDPNRIKSTCDAAVVLKLLLKRYPVLVASSDAAGLEHLLKAST